MTRPSVHVTWDDSFLAYDFGAGHPMAPVRADLTMRLARALGVLDRPGVVVCDAPVASDALLATVHEPDYIAAVRRASADPTQLDPARGIGTEDTPVFAGMHEASARIVGASVQCADRVWSGAAQHAVNVSGGLHHAMPGAASGFCVYNDAAVAVRRLLDAGAERVAYIDVDVHHGDGVERAFWNDPRVLTVSVHQNGRDLFPGTGFPQDTGGPDAPFSAVNMPLPASTGDAAWLRAFHAVVPPLVEAFAPQVVVSQQGCDSHMLDPLANFSLSIEAQRASYLAIHDLAHRVAGGRWIALGGGGYAVAQVVPRAWAHLLAIATEDPLSVDVAVPDAWRDYVSDYIGITPPDHMGDGVSADYRPFGDGYDPADPVDQAILATRAAVFPHFGLEVLHDL